MQDEIGWGRPGYYSRCCYNKSPHFTGSFFTMQQRLSPLLRFPHLFTLQPLLKRQVSRFC